MLDRSLTLAIVLASALLASTPGHPQTRCDTVLNCAQTAVEAATSADAAAKALQERVSKVEAVINRLEGQLTGPSFYRCPMSNEVGGLGGGAWGFYGCQGQVTTQSTCYVTEFPRSQSHACTPIGKLRILPPGS
jgi:hypothetical protein